MKQLLLFSLLLIQCTLFSQAHLVGYHHNWNDGSAPYINLDQVDSRYSVVNLSFAVGINGTDYDMGYTPCCGETQAGLITKIQTLQANGILVNISIGGATAPVHLDNASEVATFVSSMTTILDTYGLDGLDIDLEGSSLSVSTGSTISNPSDPNITNFISAIQQIMATYQATHGKKLFLSAAPETAFVQGAQSNWGGIWGAYLPVLDALRDEMDLLHVQLYNSGSMFGIDGNIYAQSTADFIVSQTEAVIAGFNTNGGFFTGFPASKVSVGLPACPSAAGGGFTATSVVQSAIDYLMGNGAQAGAYVLAGGPYPDLGGMMTLSVNWDAVSSCNSSAYEYAANYEDIFLSGTCIEPDLGVDISACGLTFPFVLNSNTPTNTDVTFTWTNLSTNQVLISDSPTATTYPISEAGSYQVKRDSIGCVKFDVIDVLADLPIPNVPASLDLCAVLPEILDVSNLASFPMGTIWAWYKDNTLLPNETSSTLTNILTAGMYKIEANYLNCNSEATIVVTSAVPEPIDGCGTSGESIDLAINAGTSTGPFEWYTNSTGGTAIATGTTYTTPALTTTTTFFVEDASSVGTATTGPTATANGLGTLGNWFQAKEIHFDAAASFTLKSVAIYPLIWCGTHTIAFEIRDANGAVLPNGNQSFNVVGDSDCGSIDQNPVSVNLTNGGVSIPQGSGYKLVCTSSIGINHWTGSVTYPMDYNPFFTITGGDVAGSFMGVHDWEVEGTSCARLPVVAKISCPSTLAINDNPILSMTYQASQTIQSAGTIPNGNTVTFKAGDGINLESGFSAELGCELSVEIEVCN